MQFLKSMCGGILALGRLRQEDCNFEASQKE